MKPAKLISILSFTLLFANCAANQDQGMSPPPVQPVLAHTDSGTEQGGKVSVKSNDSAGKSDVKEQPAQGTKAPDQSQPAQNKNDDKGGKEQLPDSTGPRELIAIVHFDFDRAILRDEDQTLLDHLLENLNGREISKIQITGHADRIGTNSYNKKLSRKRAEVVARYLLDRSRDLLPSPIEPMLLEIIAMGEAVPVTTRCSSRVPREQEIECLQPDRRTEVSVEIAFSSLR